MAQQLTELFQQTLDPSQSRSAEQKLNDAESNEGFSSSLLELICDAQHQLPIRQAGALYFKNYLRRNWSSDDGASNVSEADRNFIKSRVVSAMTRLPHTLQLQLGEAITIIANNDFPQLWPTLVDDLVNNLNATDMDITNGVLATAHSIFKRWRAQYRTDRLFTEIAFVLQKFCEPFLALFKQTDLLIEQNQGNNEALKILFETMTLLTKVFYDLNSQDIPEYFEDHMNEFMTILHKYLTYQNALLESAEDEDVPGPLLRAKASVCEITELYTQRYEEVFSMLPEFVNTTWNLLTGVTTALKYDILVGKALSFLTCVVKIPRHASLFESQDVLQRFVEKIVLPNMSLRPYEEELFEDDPVEYTRRDLEGGDSETRRRAATDFVRGLVEQFDHQMTGMVMQYAGHYLQQYESNHRTMWAAKDTATYLITAVAIKGVVTRHGVSSTNLMIDVVKYFDEHLQPDLLADFDSMHPILKLDVIKFILTFRNQLTIQQLTGAFPVVVRHLEHTNSVVSTYAAITIESLLTLKRESTLVFHKQSIGSVAGNLIANLLKLIEQGETPQKLAENDFLMRCVMRVILSLQEDILTFSETILQHLNTILTEISKNPSNPQFNHYLFECYGTILRNDVLSMDGELSRLESAAIPPLLTLLQSDITEFVPYVFQLLALLVEKRVMGKLPTILSELLQPLLTPSLWDARGNVPALVRLLQAFLQQEHSITHAQQSLEPLLGIFQKLLASKANDHFGFDLLETIYTVVPAATLARYKQQIFVLLLTRLNTSNTEKYTLRFVVFIFFLSALDQKAGPDYLITTINTIQSGLFVQVFTTFVLPNAQKIIAPGDTKTTSIGLTNMATKSQMIATEYFTTLWLTTITSQIRFLELPAHEAKEDESYNATADIGFQASYVRLRTASKPHRDPWSHIQDPKSFFANSLMTTVHKDNKYIDELKKLPQDGQVLLRNYGLPL